MLGGTNVKKKGLLCCGVVFYVYRVSTCKKWTLVLESKKRYNCKHGGFGEFEWRKKI
jgi:hypothetical protein